MKTMRQLFTDFANDGADALTLDKFDEKFDKAALDQLIADKVVTIVFETPRELDIDITLLRTEN